MSFFFFKWRLEVPQKSVCSIVTSLLPDIFPNAQKWTKVLGHRTGNLTESENDRQYQIKYNFIVKRNFFPLNQRIRGAAAGASMELVTVDSSLGIIFVSFRRTFIRLLGVLLCAHYFSHAGRETALPKIVPANLSCPIFGNFQKGKPSIKISFTVLNICKQGFLGRKTSLSIKGNLNTSEKHVIAQPYRKEVFFLQIQRFWNSSPAEF